MLPALLTLPLKVSREPGVTGLTGQFCVMITSGVVTSVQIAEALLVKPVPVLASRPETVRVSDTEQAFSGTR